MTDALVAGESSGLAYLTRVARRAGMDAEITRFLDRYRAAPVLDPAELHADAEALRSTAAVMRAHLLAQEQAVARLRTAWSGDAADAALATLTGHHDLARADCVAVLAAANALDDAGDLIREAALARTEFVGRMFGQRSEYTEPDWSPAVLTAHAAACLTVMTDLIAAVEGIVEDVRRSVETAVAGMYVRAEEQPVPGPEERPVAESVDGDAPDRVAPPAEQRGVPDVPLGAGSDDVPGGFGHGRGVGTRRSRDLGQGRGPSDGTGTGAELAGAGILAETDPM